VQLNTKFDDSYEPTSKVDTQDLLTIAFVVVFSYGIIAQNLSLLLVAMLTLAGAYSFFTPKRQNATPRF
jgi:hypothetical protein